MVMAGEVMMTTTMMIQTITEETVEITIAPAEMAKPSQCVTELEEEMMMAAQEEGTAIRAQLRRF